MGVMQIELPFKITAAQSWNDNLSITFWLDVLGMGGTRVIQVKAKMESQKIFWLNAVVVETGGMKLWKRGWPLVK